MATDICQGAGKVDKTTNKQTKGRGPTPSNKMEAVWFKSSKIKTNPKPAQTILGALQKKKIKTVDVSVTRPSWRWMRPTVQNKSGINDQHLLKSRKPLYSSTLTTCAYSVQALYALHTSPLYWMVGSALGGAFCWWNQNSFHRFKWGALSCDWYWKSICRNRGLQGDS